MYVLEKSPASPSSASAAISSPSRREQAAGCHRCDLIGQLGGRVSSEDVAVLERMMGVDAPPQERSSSSAGRPYRLGRWPIGTDVDGFGSGIDWRGSGSCSLQTWTM
jgi:hypothetical protein